MYWLPKLHKKTYKARFIAKPCSCTTTELSKLLTSCLIAVKIVIKYCEKVHERSGKNLFWSIKNSGEILDTLKARDFNATILSTYDFSTLYTSLPHNLIKDIDLILLKVSSIEKALRSLHITTETHILFWKKLKYIMQSRVKIYVMC